MSAFQNKNICAEVEDIKYALHYVHVTLMNKAASFHKSPTRNQGSHSEQRAELSRKLLWTYGNASALKKEKYQEGFAQS